MRDLKIVWEIAGNEGDEGIKSIVGDGGLAGTAEPQAGKNGLLGAGDQQEGRECQEQGKCEDQPKGWFMGHGMDPLFFCQSEDWGSSSVVVSYEAISYHRMRATSEYIGCFLSDQAGARSIGFR